MSTVVERVEKLIALAASPHLEEARSAAFKAAELIREHKLVVRDAHTNDAYVYKTTNEAARRHAESLAEMMRRAQAKPRPDAYKTETPIWRAIRSRWVGRCKACSDYYKAGESVYWNASVGTIHAACRAKV